MLYAIHGERNMGKAKLGELLKILRDKQPEAEVITLDEESFTDSALEELIQSQGLFSRKYIVVLDSLSESPEAEGLIIERMSDIAESEHAFLMIENKFDASMKKVVEKYAKKVYELKNNPSTSSGIKKGWSDSFALAEALGVRDKASMWELYMKEKDSMEIDKIHGGLIWQAKSILLSVKTKNAEEAMMKDYPYKKAKSYAKNYSVEELESILFNLVSVYHDAHRGEGELDVAIEKMILEI